jgi:hypothetical protein
VTRTRWAVVLSVVLAALVFARLWKPFPKDTVPEGAYMRIAKHISQGQAREIFPYLETEAQWASHTVYTARKEAAALVQKDFPEAERGRVSAEVSEFAALQSGEDAFVLMARKKGWIARLRKDLSGVASIETEGERASVITQRGTRYPFRRRDNGIWGLTIFTAELVSESVRAVRDLEAIKKSAEDYRRATAGGAAPSPVP